VVTAAARAVPTTTHYTPCSCAGSTCHPTTHRSPPAVPAHAAVAPHTPHLFYAHATAPTTTPRCCKAPGCAADQGPSTYKDEPVGAPATMPSPTTFHYRAHTHPTPYPHPGPSPPAPPDLLPHLPPRAPTLHTLPALPPPLPTAFPTPPPQPHYLRITNTPLLPSHHLPASLNAARFLLFFAYSV